MKKQISIISFLLLIVCASVFASINRKKELTYTNYTLNDQYVVGNQTRCFQWDKIDSILVRLDTFQYHNLIMATLHNYKNQSGVAPLVEPNVMGKYRNPTDTFGVERYQSIPLYSVDSMPRLIRYGLDGSLGAINADTLGYYKMTFLHIPGEWYVPHEYVTVIGPVFFKKCVFVDRTNQNIATLEQQDTCWYVRSMNPATTGLDRPPFKKSTPAGAFVIQEKKRNMYFYRDGTATIAGFAPYASRFCCGGYIHGVPTNYPRKTIAEYSSTLGTTPRSHMCVRNATSHALYIFNWSGDFDTLVFVFD